MTTIDEDEYETGSLDDLDAPDGRPDHGLEAYALYALSQGWSPIALYGVDASTGTCSCKSGPQCKTPGKHPVNLDWTNAGTMTTTDAYQWFALASRPTNIGLRTGLASGFFAFDVDPKHGGNESVLSLETQYGPLPPTRVHRTGSGGKHYLFKLPTDFIVTNSSGRLPAGIDIRGNGGLIVAPGSRTDLGPYLTESQAEIAEAPLWLLDLIRPQTLERSIEVVDSIPFDSLNPDAQAKAGRYLESAVKSEIARLDAMRTESKPDASTYRGEPWNQTVYEVCCNLLELAQSQWLDFGLEDLKAILVAHAPTDPGFTLVDVMGRLASAANKVRGRDRPMPSSITTNSWDLLTEGVRRHIPKDSEGQQVETWPSDDWTQVGNARRTLRMTAGRLAWVPERMAWYECGPDGVWRAPSRQIRDDAAAKWCARAMEAAVALEAPSYEDVPTTKTGATGRETEGPSKREQFLAFMKESSKIEMHTAVSTQLRRRAEDFGVLVHEDVFDRAPDEFACANGVVNLRTGELRPALPSEYISIASPIAYDPEMPTPHWDRFLESTHPDPEVRDFLHKALGYSMTNETSEQRMFLHFAPGTANGKSVLMNVLSNIMGDHLSPANEKTIIRQRGMASQRIGQDMVDLRNHRFLLLNETREGCELDSETVKSITSGDLRADRPHASANVKYRVTGKIHLITNHMPHFTPDAAMRRRFTVIHWAQSFVGREDPNLERKLETELPGIFAWLVRGAMRWYAEFQSSGRSGLVEPEACRRVLDEVFEEEDEIGAWIRDDAVVMDLESDPKTWTDNRTLYSSYLSWRVGQQMQGNPLSNTAFGRRLNGKSIEVKVVRTVDKTCKVRPLRLKVALMAGIPVGTN